MGSCVAKLRSIPRCSIETKTPLKDFDILGIERAVQVGVHEHFIPFGSGEDSFYARDRDGSYPLIVGGGPCVRQPQPLADFFDIIVIGDGEEANLKLTKLAAEYKGDKQRILKEAAKIEGCYVPHAAQIEVKGLRYPHVKKACVKETSNKAPYPETLVPNKEVVHKSPRGRAVQGLLRGLQVLHQACFSTAR